MEHSRDGGDGERGDDGPGAVLGFAVVGKLREVRACAVEVGNGGGDEGGVDWLGEGVDCEEEEEEEEGEEWVELRHGCTIRLWSLRRAWGDHGTSRWMTLYRSDHVLRIPDARFASFALAYARRCCWRRI